MDDVKNIKSFVQFAVILTFIALGLINDSTQYVLFGALIVLILEFLFRANKNKKYNNH